MKYYKKVMLNNPTAKESKEALAAIEEIYVYSLGQSKEYLDYLDDLPDYDLDDSSRDSLNYKIAELQYENSEYTKSIKGFSEYLKEYPNGRYVIPATFYRAESNTYLKMFSEALPDYEAVIDKGVNPFYETSILKASIISLNELKDYDKAYTYSTALLNFTTDLQLKHQAEFNAMQSAYFSNRLEEAHNLAQPLLNNQLSNTEDKVAANFVIGKYSVAKNDTGKAISAFNYVIQNNNGALSAESSYLLSQLYFNANKLEEAEQQCKQTNSLSGNYPFWIAKSLMLLSDIYVQKNDLFNARAATEAVIENFQEDAEILAEAKEQLRKIEEKENRTNRILDDEENGLLKLDNGN
jgi:TolA-binding protein